MLHEHPHVASNARNNVTNGHFTWRLPRRHSCRRALRLTFDVGLFNPRDGGPSFVFHCRCPSLFQGRSRRDAGDNLFSHADICEANERARLDADFCRIVKSQRRARNVIYGTSTSRDFSRDSKLFVFDIKRRRDAGISLVESNSNLNSPNPIQDLSCDCTSRAER